ncbi:MAG TPA: hypothetical protein VF577_07335 [Allosphingosinicella sp.]|jgi:hypothetical protein
MRHEQLSKEAAAGRAFPVAAAWPPLFEADALAPPAAANDRPAVPAPAVPDVPRGVWTVFVGSYALLIGVLFALMARSPLALMSILIAAGFVAIYFAIPRLFLKVEADPARRPSFDRFMDQGVETLTGHTGGRDALLQMMIVPVLLTLGLGAMGIIGLIFI